MVLITGASGFIGQHLVRHLSAAGVGTRALYHMHPPGDDLKSLPHIEWAQCDLLDVIGIEEVMQDVTDVYHFAAILSFDPHMREQLLRVNPEATANIVNQSLLQGVNKLVHLSSIAALGRAIANAKEIVEDQEWTDGTFNSAYAISKYQAEMEVWRGIGEGLNAVILNPGIVLGPGRGLHSQLLKMAYREFPYYTTGVNSWVDVTDVVRAAVMLMQADVTAERYIISCGNFSYKDILGRMAKALGKKPPRFAAGPLISGIVWRLGALQGLFSGKKPLITKETARNANMKCYYNNSKLLTAFPGFTYTPIEQTIEGMARSFTKSYKK